MSVCCMLSSPPALGTTLPSGVETTGMVEEPIAYIGYIEDSLLTDPV